MGVLRDKSGGRLVVPVFIMLSVVVASTIYFLPVPPPVHDNTSRGITIESAGLDLPRKLPPGTPIKYVEISGPDVYFKEALVSIRYTDAELKGHDEKSLRLYHYNGAAWEALPTTIDLKNNIISAPTSSFSLFAVSALGSPRLDLTTNRLVVLDDPSGWDGGAAGVDDVGNQWSGESTTIRWYVLVINSSGRGAQNIVVTSHLLFPNGTIALIKTNTSNHVGIAAFEQDMDRWLIGNGSAGEGIYRINATAEVDGLDVANSYNFTYDEWGCGSSGGGCHVSLYWPGGFSNSKNITQNSAWTNGSVQNSPYLHEWDSFHIQTVHRFFLGQGECLTCHRGYDGVDRNHSVRVQSTPQYPAGVHFGAANCTGCHATFGTGTMPILQCYDCHPLRNNNLTVRNFSQTASSGFSYEPSVNSSIMAHNSGENIPCIQCHNGMHNVSKPYNATEASNTYTEYQQCTSCHTAYSRHNDSVSCTVCHSQDAHAIKVFAPNATYINETAGAGNCTGCHQNASFLDILLLQSRAGSHPGSAPQVQEPVKHSDDPINGSKWNSTDPYWINTSQVSMCKYCHGETLHKTEALGRPSLFSGGNEVNSSISPGSTWCQQCHWQAASDYSSMVSVFGGDNMTIPPEITGNITYGANPTNPDYFDHSDVAKDDSSCSNCHGKLDVDRISGLMHNVAIKTSGSADCISCHDTGGIAGPGRLVNFTAMNDSNAIHKNLNIGDTSNTGLPAENRKCWACHGNGTAPDDHPANYRTPYNCTSCHIQGTGQNLNFTPGSILNVTQHYWNGTNITTSAATTCYICHNRSEMMIGLDLDPDGAATVYGGINGGNNSTSHYGRKRIDYPAQGTTDYCNKCHYNTSAPSVFPYLNAANATIANHSINYNNTNPSCDSCHATQAGRIHNGTLFKPVFSLPNSSYCLSCHGSGGTATIKDYERHNGTKGLNCTQCHLNTSKSIHPVRYLQQGGTTWVTSKTNLMNCTTCHQGSGLENFSTAPIIPTPINHSTNIYSGALWNGTQARFWDNTSQQSSCDYCHGKIALHNTSGLGNITIVKGSNSARQGFGGGYWCANCHYGNAVNYSGDRFTPQPPEVLNRSGLVPVTANDGTQFHNHSEDLVSIWDDAKCKECHDNGLGAGATSLDFAHNLGPGGGAANCTSCHGLAGTLGVGRRINESAMNASIHRDLNKDASASDLNYSASKKCWACHGDGTEPAGHPARYRTPYNCTDCHIPAGGQNFNYSPNDTILNVMQHYWNGTNITTKAVTTCYDCHNRSEMMAGNIDPDGPAGVYGGANGGNNSSSHYGIKRHDLRSWDSGNSANCSYCHQNTSTAFASVMLDPSVNTSIFDHTDAVPGADCYNSSCHSSGLIHDSALQIPELTIDYCGTICHTITTHNSTVNCWNCHQDPNGTMSRAPPHGMMYPQENGSYLRFEIGTPANCTTCHIFGLVNTSEDIATVVPPLNHSTDPYSGGKWGNYWDNTSMITACYYCHQARIHAAIPVGNVSLIKGSNTFNNPDLANSTWCSNCHYSISPQYNGSGLTPPPPEITNSSLSSSDGTPFFDHTGFAYNDSVCKGCHGGALSGYLETSLNFSHRVSEGGGGPDCVSCHDVNGTGAPQDKRILESAIERGVHLNLNSNATNSTAIDPLNKACWACHGNGSEPVGHPENYANPRKCSNNDCHSLVQSFKAPMIYSHFKDASLNDNPNNVTNFNISANVSCETCHSISLTEERGNLSAAVSHYASRKDLIDSINCIYCHLDKENAEKWGNGTEINKNTTSLVEMDRLKNKFMAHSGEFFDLGSGYRLKVVDVSIKRGSAAIELYKADDLVDSALVNIGEYVYEEYRTIDHSNFKTPVIILNITGMFISGDASFLQFEGFKLKRPHYENKTTSCYLCHFNGYDEKHKYTVIERRDEFVYYTEVLFNSSDKKEYDQDAALKILANKTPNDSSADIERASRKMLRQGETWEVAPNFRLTLEDISSNSESAVFLLEAGDKSQKDIKGRRDTLVFELSINYLGYTFSNVTIFRANVSEIMQPDLVVLENITVLSPDIRKIKDNTSIYGYNTSWLWENNTFLTGRIPVSLHAPLLQDGRDGGSDCMSCHSIGDLGAHEGLNSNPASSSKTCWACHGSGGEPNHHPANYRNPRMCKSCHVERIMPFFNATYIGDERHGTLDSCEACHVADTHKIIRFDVAPGIKDLTISRNEVVSGETIIINATATAGFAMRIRGGEYYIDSPDFKYPMSPQDGSFDGQVEKLTAVIDTSSLMPGTHIAYVNAMERDNKWGHEIGISFNVREKEVSAEDGGSKTRSFLVLMIFLILFISKIRKQNSN